MINIKGGVGSNLKLKTGSKPINLNSYPYMIVNNSTDTGMVKFSDRHFVGQKFKFDYQNDVLTFDLNSILAYSPYGNNYLSDYFALVDTTYTYFGKMINKNKKLVAIYSNDFERVKFYQDYILANEVFSNCKLYKMNETYGIIDEIDSTEELCEDYDINSLYIATIPDSDDTKIKLYSYNDTELTLLSTTTIAEGGNSMHFIDNNHLIISTNNYVYIYKINVDYSLSLIHTYEFNALIGSDKQGRFYLAKSDSTIEFYELNGDDIELMKQITSFDGYACFVTEKVIVIYDQSTFTFSILDDYLIKKSGYLETFGLGQFALINNTEE